jgi:hypothetical protein
VKEEALIRVDLAFQTPDVGFGVIAMLFLSQRYNGKRVRMQSEGIQIRGAQANYVGDEHTSLSTNSWPWKRTR